MRIISEKCPRCGSTNTRIIEASYPKAYECKKCGFIFLKAQKALVDE